MENNIFNYELSIRINDLNYGKHLGYAQLVNLLHQTRIKFLNYYSFTEFNLQGTQLLIKQLNINYKNEAFLCNNLKISLHITQDKKTTIMLHYLIYNLSLRNETAHATETCLFKNTQTKKITRPTTFWEKFLVPLTIDK